MNRLLAILILFLLTSRATAHIECVAAPNLNHKVSMNEAEEIKPVPHPKDKRFQDLTGMKFGRLTVVGYAGKSNSGSQIWKCLCECGKFKSVSGRDIKNGHTKSCGCYNQEASAKRRTTHGMTYTPEYMVWAAMLRRCTNPNTEDYTRYGGRGIAVCEEWRHSFENFLADMGPKPSKNHSIDRIDNSNGYSNENCRWATRIEQANNKRNNVWITIEGVAKTPAQWARESEVSVSTINRRLIRGVSGVALIEPIKGRAHEPA